jgi:hypothetical protein
MGDTPSSLSSSSSLTGPGSDVIHMIYYRTEICKVQVGFVYDLLATIYSKKIPRPLESMNIGV